MRNFKTMTMAAFVALAVPAVAQAAPDLYPTPGVQNPQGSFIVIAANSGNLIAWYTGPSAGFTNFGGMNVNGVDRPYALNNQTSSYGQMWDFGSVNAGDTIRPYIYVQDTQKTYYTDAALNDDGIVHAYYTTYAGDADVPFGYNITFEDLPDGGDFNYTDYGFSFDILQGRGVPEPATWALMILGFGAIGASMRRRGRMTTRLSYN